MKTLRKIQQEKTFTVQIFADGKFIQTCVVQAQDEWKAQTRAMLAYDGPSGVMVTYNITDKE